MTVDHYIVKRPDYIVQFYASCKCNYHALNHLKTMQNIGRIPSFKPKFGWGSLAVRYKRGRRPKLLSLRHLYKVPPHLYVNPATQTATVITKPTKIVIPRPINPLAASIVAVRHD